MSATIIPCAGFQTKRILEDGILIDLSSLALDSTYQEKCKEYFVGARTLTPIFKKEVEPAVNTLFEKMFGLNVNDRGADVVAITLALQYKYLNKSLSLSAYTECEKRLETRADVYFRQKESDMIHKLNDYMNENTDRVEENNILITNNTEAFKDSFFSTYFSSHPGFTLSLYRALQNFSNAILDDNSEIQRFGTINIDEAIQKWASRH